jgi:hypothetical protein
VIRPKISAGCAHVAGGFGNDDRTVGGIAGFEAFRKAYEAETGTVIDLRAVMYWQVIAETRWAIISRQQEQRALSGGETSLELALSGYLTAEMERNMLALITEIEGRRGRGAAVMVSGRKADRSMKTDGDKTHHAEMVSDSGSNLGSDLGAAALVSAVRAEFETNIRGAADNRYSAAMIARGLLILERRVAGTLHTETRQALAASGFDDVDTLALAIRNRTLTADQQTALPRVLAALVAAQLSVSAPDQS